MDQPAAKRSAEGFFPEDKPMAYAVETLIERARRSQIQVVAVEEYPRVSQYSCFES